MGNILTILGGIVVATMGIISIETANAKRDEKLLTLENRVSRNEVIKDHVVKVKEDVIRIQVNQKNQYVMLERIIKHLEK
jgi:hypothetical protein